MKKREEIIVGDDCGSGTVVIAKVETVIIKDEKGELKYASELSYYAPGQMSEGCSLLDCTFNAVADTFGHNKMLQ